MRALNLGLLALTLAGLASATPVVHTGRSSYGTTVTPFSVACSPAAHCEGEGFNSSNFTSDYVFAYQLIGSSDFTLEISSSTAALAGDTAASPYIGAFIGSASGSAYSGQNPGANDDYTCGAALGCSTSNVGFDITFHAQDAFDAGCSSFTPIGNSAQSCGLVFFVVENSDITPTATFSPSSSTPEPATLGLIGLGVFALGCLGRIRSRRRYCA